MFRFAQPYAFLLFLPLAAAAWFVYRRRVHRGVLFAPLSRLPAPRASWREALRRVAPPMFLLGLALIVPALARPQTVLSRVRRQTEAIAVEMVVNVSGSMRALDFSTAQALRSRLNVVKETFADFILRRPDDLVGLVSFGGYAVTRAPLTLDHDALLEMLRAVEIPREVQDSDGNVVNSEELRTAIGDALATAAGRLRDAQVKSKIIVLLSDGESNTGAVKPDEAAKAAKALGIKVYTIGVGTTGRAPVLVRDMFDQLVRRFMDVTLDEALLRQIADATGGRYFNVRDTAGLEQALAHIDALERTKVDREIYEQYNELFLRFLAPAAILLMAAAWLNVALVRAIV